MSTIKAANIQNPSAASAAIVLDTSGNFSVPAGTVSAPGIQAPSDSNTGIFFPAADTIAFAEGGTEAMRIDSSSRLLVGTSSSSADATLVLMKHSGDANGPGILHLSNPNSAPGSGAGLGLIRFSNSTQNTFASIEAYADAASGSNDYPGRLVFSTTADGASSPTERMRITNAGIVSIGHNTTYTSDITAFSAVQSGQSSVAGVFANSNSSFDQAGYGILGINCARAANSGFTFAGWYSGNTGDKEFNFRGDGNGYADGTWNGGGADYAELFEWSDANIDEEDRRGISVVLDGEKIREAVTGEDPIGVISGNPSVVGDAAWNKWSGKYLRDEFGSYLLDAEGYRQLNPAFDPDVEYIPREQRPEWDCVGLMGKLRIRKGQVTGARWIKMRDISDSVEEWLVR